MKYCLFLASAALLLAGCENGHTSHDVDSGTPHSESVHYTPQVLTELDSDILNLAGAGQPATEVENLARTAIYPLETLLKAMAIKDLDHLIAFSEEQFYLGNTKLTLNNGDQVSLGIFQADASQGNLAITITGRTALFSGRLPKLIESQSGSKAPNYPTAPIDLILSIIIDPSQSLTRLQMEFDGTSYNVTKYLNKISYSESVTGRPYTNVAVYEVNNAQVAASIEQKQYHLFYNPSKDTLSK